MTPCELPDLPVFHHIVELASLTAEVAANPAFQDIRSVSPELPILTNFDRGTMFV